MMIKYIFTVLFIALCKTELSKARCTKKDVMVVVELSTANMSASVNQTISFMEQLKERLNPTKNCLRLGFTFSALNVIKLDCDYEACYKKAKRVVRKIARSFGGRYFESNFYIGIRNAMKQLVLGGTEPKTRREKILVSVSSKRLNNEIIDVTRSYADSNIKIMAVSVMGGVERNLGAISSGKNYELQLQGFGELESKAATIIAERIDPKIIYGARVNATKEAQAALMDDNANVSCSNIVDIAFLLDSSGSVEDYYDKERDFVGQIAKRFRISKEGTHAGVVVFSSYGYTNVAINFTRHLTTSSFNEAVNGLEHHGFTTRIDRALEVAHTDLFTEKGNTRPNVKKLLFLITDGVQAPAVENGKRLDPSLQAEKLHRNDVQIYAVGVGNKINLTELEGITKDPEKVFLVSDFEKLISTAFVKNVSKQLCEGANKEKRKPDTNSVDKGCNKASCGCGCCGKSPVYVNIFQSSNNYVNQGQEVTQSGGGSSAGSIGQPNRLQSIIGAKDLTDKEVLNYIKNLLPHFESMNKGWQKMLTRVVKNNIGDVK